MIIEDCIECGLCKSVCPLDCIEFAYTGAFDYLVFQNAIIDLESCICCCACVKNCPVDAIDFGVRCRCSFGRRIGDDGRDDPSDENWGNDNGSKPIPLPKPCQIDASIGSTMDYTNGLYKAHPTLSWCNKGVAKHFELLTGNTTLGTLTANKMLNLWSTNPTQWEAIEMKDAQELANSGEFVVAGKTENGESGHVVVIIPGKGEGSGNWGGKVPMGMDTGKGKRWPNTTYPNGRGVNRSWTKPTGVLFFKYIGTRVLNKNNFPNC